MEDREYVKWGRVAKGVGVALLGGAQTGFGISDMGEGIHDIYLGFKDVDDEEQQAVRISKKVLGKYEEPLNFAVGGTTNQAVEIGQAFNRFPISNMTENTNSSTISSNVTTEKQKTNNTGTEKVVEDTTTVKTVGSNNKDDSNIVQKNNQNTANKQQKVTSVDKKQKLNYSISIEKKQIMVKKIRIYITILLFYLISI